MMSDFYVTILGNGSAVPTSNQHPSAQIVKMAGQQFMIDCGEGTQMQMIKYGIKHRNLDHIFISHLHGDHYFGIFGLISTFHLFGRSNPLNIYAPLDLKGLIDHQLRISRTNLKFRINFCSSILITLLIKVVNCALYILATVSKFKCPSRKMIFCSKLIFAGIFILKTSVESISRCIF